MTSAVNLVFVTAYLAVDFMKPALRTVLLLARCTRNEFVGRPLSWAYVVSWTLRLPLCRTMGLGMSQVLRMMPWQGSCVAVSSSSGVA